MFDITLLDSFLHKWKDVLREGNNLTPCCSYSAPQKSNLFLYDESNLFDFAMSRIPLGVK
jgi:hypothetical protein